MFNIPGEKIRNIFLNQESQEIKNQERKQVNQERRIALIMGGYVISNLEIADRKIKHS